MVIYFDAIKSLRPGVGFGIEDNDLSKIIWYDGFSDIPSDEEIENEYQRLLAEAPWVELRKERDRLISETDWWVLPDRTPTQEQLDYRQALRDLPANTDDPANPVWPIKP